jgi:hypothetical protein
MRKMRNEPASPLCLACWAASIACACLAIALDFLDCSMLSAGAIATSGAMALAFWLLSFPATD